VSLLVNIDVDDLEKATRFYCDGCGLRVGLLLHRIHGPRLRRDCKMSAV